MGLKCSRLKWFRELKIRKSFRQSQRTSRRGVMVAGDNSLNQHTELVPGSSHITVYSVAVRVD